MFKAITNVVEIRVPSHKHTSQQYNTNVHVPWHKSFNFNSVKM